MNVKTDPAMEAIARKLSGIDIVTPDERAKMIKAAVKAGREVIAAQVKLVLNILPDLPRNKMARMLLLKIGWGEI